MAVEQKYTIVGGFELPEVLKDVQKFVSQDMVLTGPIQCTAFLDLNGKPTVYYLATLQRDS